MKNLTTHISVFVLAMLSSFALGQTQSQMNKQAFKYYVIIDKELNVVYKKLSSEIDPQLRKKLKISQKHWIVFRDAEAELIADLTALGGSMRPAIYDSQRARLTEERTDQLRKLLKDHLEINRPQR